MPYADDDGWQEGDEEFEADDEDDTIPCPYCCRQIHEESERCPFCENYITGEDAPPTLKPWWFIVGFLLCSVVVFMWIAQR
jgi:hypothetical protein